MADNVAITAGSGTPIATDDIGGTHYQRVKVTFGADGLASDVSASAPLPVTSPLEEYETVAASATAQVLGATGGAGDLLSHLIIVPATTSPGAVSIKDGAGSAITVFMGGTDSVQTLIPFTVPLNMKSTSGAWSVTTGANVSAIGVGNFA